jgi:predicted Zn-dependent peptidase
MPSTQHARREIASVDLIPFPAEVSTARLANGLRIVTVACPHLHGAAATLYVGAGSRYETARSNGLSHFVEHMLFRGSAGYPSSFALNRAIEERCGMLNGETGRDYSLFQVCFHPRELDEVLGILGDLFATPQFSDIDLERKIVLEEILDDFDERGQRVNLDDVGRVHAWRGHPLGFPITGPARNIRRFSRAEVVAHFRRHYGAGNLVLAVAGPLASAHVLACARRAFGRLPAGRRQRARRAPASLGGPRFRCVRTDSAQVELQLLFHGLPERHPLYPALVLLLRLLDDGMATPLHYRVCDRRGLAYHVNAGLEPLVDTALIEITAACAAGNLLALLDEIFAILCELRERPAAARELAKAKRRYARDLEAGFDDVEGLCAWYGDSVLCERPLRSPVERYRRVARVAADEVRRVARQLLRPERLVVTAVGNFTPAVVRKTRARVRQFTSAC